MHPLSTPFPITQTLATFTVFASLLDMKKDFTIRSTNSKCLILAIFEICFVSTEVPSVTVLWCWLEVFLTSIMSIINILFYFRSSRPEVLCKKGVLRNLTKFTGKHLCQGLTLFKKSLLRRCFLVNFVKFLRTPFFTEHLWFASVFRVFFGILYRSWVPRCSSKELLLKILQDSKENRCFPVNIAKVLRIVFF